MPRTPGHRNYAPERFQSLLRELLQKTAESYRQASKAAGLDSSAISRYLSSTRPSRDACVALADHFGINPNEMLEAAGYKPLAFFEEGPLEPGQASREVKELITKIQQINDPRIRRRLIDAIGVMLEAYLPAETAPAAEPRRKPAGGLKPIAEVIS